MKGMEVEDKKSEFRALVNNILTFLILGVMTWVGVNITQMKDGLATIKVNDAIVKIKVDHLEANDIIQANALSKHLEEDNARWIRIENKLDKLNKGK